MPAMPGCAPEGSITARALRPSAVLGRYTLVRRIGSGGFGAVWLARDETLRRDVAVKIVPRENAEDRGGRPGREALATARLNHPGIVALYEAGQDEQAHYLVSELVVGETIDVLASAGDLSDRDVARIGIALCDALDHAHAQGVVHRDVKPQNVIVPEAPQSAAGVAKLTDFGVASLAGDDRLTRTGDVVGTLAYMAPEQAEGHPAGPESDLYALALVVYEAFAGHNPVRGTSPAATARRLGQTVPTLARPRADLPPRLVEAVDTALAVDPAARGSIGDLRAALAAGAPDLSDEPGVVGRARLRRLALPVRAGGALAAGALAGAAALAVGPDAGLIAPLFAIVVAAAVALAPRVGWVIAALATVAWLIAGTDPHAGTAVIVLAATVACPLLAPRAQNAWSLPPLAPLLGLVGLAGAYPALAGQGRTAWSRAAIGALGFWWLALAQALLGSDLYTGAAPGTLPPEDWNTSATAALAHAIAPLLSSGALAFAVLWGAAAMVLPIFVRGRSWPLVIVGAVAWSAGLASAAGVLGRALGGAVPGPQPHGLTLGAIAGGVVAVVAWASRRGSDMDGVT